MAGDGSHALLVLGFESSDHPVDAQLARALEICAEHGGTDRRGRIRRRRGQLLARGVPRRPLSARRAGGGGHPGGDIRDRRHLGSLHRRCTSASRRLRARRSASRAAIRAGSSAASPTCIRTARRPTSPSSRPAVRGQEVEQWAAVKQAVGDAIIAEGGTITHHHAVGRDHRPWYDRQRPDPFASALAGAKEAVDPAGVMNPGVLIDPSAMRIAVLGPGGVGGLIAGALARAGEDVIVVAQPSTAEVIAERGLRVSSVTLGDFVARPAGGLAAGAGSRRADSRHQGSRAGVGAGARRSASRASSCRC